MRNPAIQLAVGLGALLTTLGYTPAALLAEKAGAARPYGIDKRVLWTTSKIKGAPDPPPPYRTELAFPKLKFAEPLVLASISGTDRLFVSERYGKIYSFDPSAQKAELLIDLGKVIYGLALHPQFTTNGYYYVTYVLENTNYLPRGTHLSRFQVNRDNPLRSDKSSEKLLLVWPSGGHNGGCLKFGPDGYLYVSIGDAGEIADPLDTGQDLSDLPGSLLRIDVDHPAGGKPYGIPKDNPFVGVKGARPEIWAYGLRQLWKLSFDTKTGDLWGGNVGQDLWEAVLLVQRGGNYGWSVTEGSHPFRPLRKKGPSPILLPILEYDHTQGRSITGGFVYHGSRLKELAGAYIYGDYDSGRMWALRYDQKNQQVTWHQELANTNLRLVGFGEDNAGEIYMVDHMGGGLHRLVKSPPSDDTSQEFPRQLSQTGLFASVRNQTPAPGVIPYTVNAPVWSDGARKERFLALPGDTKIELDAMTYPQPAPHAPPGWKFPDGTVIAETLSLEMKQGDPSSRRRLETRILHHRRLAGNESMGDQYWQGYTYLWNDEQTDAILLEDPQGRDRTYTIADSRAPGGKRRQTWHFPARTECTICHNMAAKYVLGVNTFQLNKAHDYAGVTDNQLRTFEHLGLFTAPLPARPEKLPRLVDYSNEKLDLNRRTRSYLHSNCSHCHRKWGGGNAEFQLLYNMKLADTKTVGVRPGQGTFQISQAHLLTPGDPYRSLIFYRMANQGPGRMPRLGSAVVHEAGLRLIHDWITQLPTSSDSAPTTALAQSQAKAVSTLRALRSSDGKTSQTREQQIDRLLNTTNSALRLLRAIDAKSLPRPVRQQAIARATQHAAPHVRDLFERFLPEEKRTQRLGSVIRPEQILALPGDIGRGKQVFFQAEGVQCKSCHRIGEQGTELGPDLSQIGKKYTRAQMLDTILHPSKQIEPKFQLYLAETKDGRIFTGLLVEKTAGEVVLKDDKAKLIRLRAADVEQLLPQQISMMPDLLLRDMTARQVADLTAYLSSLK